MERCSCVGSAGWLEYPGTVYGRSERNKSASLHPVGQRGFAALQYAWELKAETHLLPNGPSGDEQASAGLVVDSSYV